LEGAGCDDRYGDEPVLLAAGLPEVSVWVGSARWKTGEAAIRCDGAEVIILDDGFQHLSLERDVDLVLLDGKNPFGNGRLLPVGPLREPVEHLGRADAFVLSDDGSGGEGSGNDDGGSAAHRVLFPRVPIFRFRRRVRGFRQGFMGTRFPPNALEGKRVLAFCGIARPERFFNTLKSLGIWVCTTLVFPDHHRFRPRDWERIFSLARKSGASYLVTTEKDLVRVPPALRPALISVELETYLGPDENRFMAFMAAKFRASRPGRPLCFR
jgi:tetraacyldisaccharide 4'-kinase